MSARPKSPYVGPYPIEAGQPFYGRQHETEELASRLIARRVVLLHSPSGAGKTSLVQAGLIPEMEAQKYLILPIIHMNRTGMMADLEGKQPERFLLSCLLSLDSALPEDLRSSMQDLAEASLRPGGLAEYLEVFRPRFAQLKNQSDRRRTLIIFDQFEEILTIQPAEKASKEAFFNELMPVLDDNRYWALFAMRDDFLARLDPYLGYFPERLNAHFQLDFLGLEAALQAIVEPARLFEVEYGDDAAQQLVHDLSLVRVLDENNQVVERPGLYIEPVELQVVCQRLWQVERPDPAQISLQDVQKSGKVVDALAGYYADMVKKSADDTGDSERDIRRWFEQALIAEGGLRQPVPQGSEIEFGVSPVSASKLVNAYLVRMEEQRGTLWYRLAHDRLVDAVRSDNARWNAENLSLLQRQALLWEREGRPDRLLLQGADLVEAERWYAGEHEELNYIESDLMERSREQHREREAAREKERLSNRRIRRYLLAAVSVAVVAVLALLFAVWAWGQAQSNSLEARNQRNAAKTAQADAEGQKQIAQLNSSLAETERARAETNRIRAEEKAAEALDEKYKASTAQARAEAGEESARQALIEGERLATAAAQEQAAGLSQRLAFDAQQIASSDPDLAALLSVAAYKASRTTAATNMLISSIYTSTVTIETDKTIGGFTSDIYSLAISPDEKTLAVGGRDGNVYVVDLEAATPIPVVLPARHENTVNGLAFSPDGELLASSGSDGRLIIFGKNPIAQTIEWTFREYRLTGGSSGLSFRPDGLKLAVAESFEYSIFDVTPGNFELGRKSTFLRGRKNGYIHDIAYSPDGLRLAVSHQGETGNDLPDWVIVYNAETGGREYLNDDHTEFIPSLAWSVDNRTLVSVSLDGRIIASDVLYKTTQKVEKAHNSNTIYGVSTSYDGKYVVTGGWDGYTRLWDLLDLQPLGAEPNTDLLRDVLTVTFSPRSYLFASAGSDRRVILRRLITQPSLAEPVITADGPVRALSVDPQGQLFWTFLERSSRRYTTLSTDPNFFYGKPGDIDFASSVALHPDGKTVAYGGKNGVIYSALTEDPFSEAWPAIPEANEIWGLAFSPDGKQLASSYCAETGKGRCVRSNIVLWDVAAREFRGFTEIIDAGLVRGLAFSPDGKYLAIGAENGLVKVLDMKTGTLLPLNIEPSSSEVLSLAFSKDSKMLAGGNRAGDMLLWDASSNFQDLGRLNVGSGGALFSLAFDLEGSHLYTGGASGEIMNWAISPDLWVEIICQRVGRNLTVDEWRTFFFNEDVQPVCPEG